MSVNLPGKPAPAKVDSSDVLLHKGIVSIQGFKLIFSSKLTTSADKMIGFFENIFFKKQMREQGAHAAKAIITDLNLNTSSSAAVRDLALDSLQNITVDKTASRSALDKLLLLAYLEQPTLIQGHKDYPKLKEYAQLRIKACLVTLLADAGKNRRHASALMDYIKDPKTTIDHANTVQKQGDDPKLLHLALISCSKHLTKTVQRMAEADPLKAALSSLNEKLIIDLRSLPPIA